MDSVVVIGTEEPISQQISQKANAAGAVLAHVLTADEALLELRRTDQAVAVVVLGPELREPIQTLQRIHSLATDLAVIVLAAPNRVASLKKAISFAPLIGRHVLCLDANDPAQIDEAVAQSLESARQRKSYLTLVTELNQGLAARRKTSPSHSEAWKHAFIDRLLESVPMGIASVDASGKVLSWNRGAFDIFGRSEVEMIGSSFPDLFTDPEAVRAIRTQIRRAAAERAFRSTPFVFMRSQESSSPQAIEVTVATTEGKEYVSGAIILFQDVTDRVTAHRQLAERETLFRSFFNLAGVGIAQTAVPDGKFLRTNAKLQAILGYTESELQQMSFMDLTHPEERERDLQAAKEFASGGRSSYSVEKRYIRKDGQVIWVSLDVEVVKDEAGGATSTLAAVQDITESKESEGRLREAIRARDEFLSLASHELKTPISSIKLQLQTILRFSDTGREVISDKVTGKLRSASQQVDRLTNLIEDLLEVTRMANAKLQYSFSEMDMTAAVEGVLSSFSEMASAAGCEVSFEAQGAVIGCWDRFRLEQVISNLLSNAIRYGGGKPIRISLKKQGADAVLEVKDHGIGIPPEAQTRIFDRFE